MHANKQHGFFSHSLFSPKLLNFVKDIHQGQNSLRIKVSVIGLFYDSLRMRYARLRFDQDIQKAKSSSIQYFAAFIISQWHFIASSILLGSIYLRVINICRDRFLGRFSTVCFLWCVKSKSVAFLRTLFHCLLFVVCEK